MGNQQNYQSKLLEKYQVIDRTRNAEPIVKSRNDQAQYILKIRTFSSKEDSYVFHQYLQKKIRLNSTKMKFEDYDIEPQNIKQNNTKLSIAIHNQSNVVQVKQIYQRWQNDYCGKWYRIYTLIEYSSRTFEDQIRQRKESQQYFSEDQIWSTLFSICCGLLQLQYLGTSIAKVQLSMIFLDQEGSIKLFDPYLIDQYYSHPKENFKGRHIKIQNSVALVILQSALLKTEWELDENSMDLFGRIYSYPLYSIISQMLEAKLDLRSLVQACMDFLKMEQQLPDILEKQEKQRKGITISSNYLKSMERKVDIMQKKNIKQAKQKDNLLNNSYHFVKKKYSKRHQKNQKSSLQVRSHSKSQKRFSANIENYSQNRKRSTISLDYKSSTRMSTIIQSPHLSGLVSPNNEIFKIKKSTNDQQYLPRRASEAQIIKNHNFTSFDRQFDKSRNFNYLVQDEINFGIKQRLKTDFLQQKKATKQTERLFSFKNSEDKQYDEQFLDTAYFKKQKQVKTSTNVKKKLKFKYQNQTEEDELGLLDRVKLKTQLEEILIDNNASKQKAKRPKDFLNHRFPKKTSFIKKKIPNFVDIDTKKFAKQKQQLRECNLNTMKMRQLKDIMKQNNAAEIQIPNDLLSISPVGNEKCQDQTSRNNFSPPQFLDMVFQNQLDTYRGNQQTRRVTIQRSNETIIEVSERYESQFTTDRKREQIANPLDQGMHIIQQFKGTEKSLSQSKVSNHSQMKLRKIKELFGSTSSIKTEQNKNNGISSRITVKRQYCSSFLQGMTLQDVETLNIKNGYEKVNFEDGAYYQGQWLNNQMHGYGKLYYPSGNLAYCGFWSNNLFQGTGILINDENKGVAIEQIDYRNMSNLEGNWYKYEGGFKGDLIHGEGVLIFRDGSKIKGEWMSNKLEGVATFQIPKVKKVIGYYEENILVKVYQEINF